MQITVMSWQAFPIAGGCFTIYRKNSILHDFAEQNAPGYKYINKLIWADISGMENGLNGK